MHDKHCICDRHTVKHTLATHYHQTLRKVQLPLFCVCLCLCVRAYGGPCSADPLRVTIAAEGESHYGVNFSDKTHSTSFDTADYAYKVL